MPRLPAPRIPTGSVYYRRGGGRKEVVYRYLIEDVVEKNLELGRAESGLFLFTQQASFAKEKPPVHGFYPLFCAWDKDRTFRFPTCHSTNPRFFAGGPDGRLSHKGHF